MCGDSPVRESGPPTTPVTDEMRWAGAEAIWTEVDGPLAVGPEVQGHDRNLLRAQACLEAALPLVPSERRVAALEKENERLKNLLRGWLTEAHAYDRELEAATRAALGDRSP